MQIGARAGRGNTTTTSISTYKKLTYRKEKYIGTPTPQNRIKLLKKKKKKEWGALKKEHGKLDGPDPCKRLIVCARRIAKTFYFHTWSSQARLEPHPQFYFKENFIATV